MEFYPLNADHMIGIPGEFPQFFVFRSGTSWAMVANDTGYFREETWQFLEENCNIMCHTLPFLRKLKVVRQWAGLYDMSPDHAPVIDESKNAAGLWNVCGFSGHGFMIGPRIGILVANGVCGLNDSLDIKMFSGERYKTGNILVEPAVV